MPANPQIRSVCSKRTKSKRRAGSSGWHLGRFRDYPIRSNSWAIAIS